MEIQIINKKNKQIKMKNLKSNTEGVWIETKPMIFTEEQKSLMMSKKESDKEDKIALMGKIKAESEVTPDELILALAIAKYNYLKPVVSETGTYELIGCNMSIGDRITGIINCRVNGEHKQIRF